MRQAGIVTREQELEFRRELRKPGPTWWWMHYRCPLCEHVRVEINSSARLPYRLWLVWMAVLASVMVVRAFLTVLRQCPQCRFERKVGRWRGWLGDG